MGCCQAKPPIDNESNGQPNAAQSPSTEPEVAKSVLPLKPEAAKPEGAAPAEVPQTLEPVKSAAPAETLSAPDPAPPAAVEEATPAQELPQPAQPTEDMIPPTAAALEPAGLVPAAAAGPAEAADAAEGPPPAGLGEAVAGAIQLVFSPLASLGRSMSSLFNSGEASSGGGAGSGSGSGGAALEATVTKLETLVGDSSSGSGSGAADGAPPSGTPTAAQVAQLEELVSRLEVPRPR